MTLEEQTEEIKSLLEEGFDIRTISKMLMIGHPTVKWIVQNVLNKHKRV